MEARHHRDFLYLALLMRNLADKEALRVLSVVLRLLAVSDKILRYRRGLLIKLNMRVRRGKTCLRQKNQLFKFVRKPDKTI